MLIDDEGFELGSPTLEKMIRHQVVLLRHESEESRRQLAKAKADVQKLVDINAQLNSQMADLHRQLREVRSRLCVEFNLKRHAFSTWGGADGEAGRQRVIRVYPML
ncbi:hypothetical protein AAZU54_06495 [Pseudomonas sp. Je.1.5.c]|uniref:hypothetical protein n=1 Tax=Pseudomonas sp. Je.1.5.c TaxID=3142839 RepID=UPI003DA7C448